MHFRLVYDDARPSPWAGSSAVQWKPIICGKKKNTNLQHTYLLWDWANTCDGLSISKGCEYIVSGPVTPPAWMSDNLHYYCHGPPAIYQNTAERQYESLVPKLLKLPWLEGGK